MQVFATFRAPVLDMESANGVPHIAVRSPAGNGEGTNRVAIFLDLAAGNAAAVVRAIPGEIPGHRWKRRPEGMRVDALRMIEPGRIPSTPRTLPALWVLTDPANAMEASPGMASTTQRRMTAYPFETGCSWHGSHQVGADRRTSRSISTRVSSRIPSSPSRRTELRR